MEGNAILKFTTFQTWRRALSFYLLWLEGTRHSSWEETDERREQWGSLLVTVTGATVSWEWGNDQRSRMEQPSSVTWWEPPREKSPGSNYCTYHSLSHLPPFPQTKEKRVKQETPNPLTVAGRGKWTCLRFQWKENQETTSTGQNCLNMRKT